MVLHYITNDAEFIEVASSAFCAKGFLECDLDIGNMLTGPCGAEESICESQDKEILHHFLAQIMIDSECLYQDPSKRGTYLVFFPDWSEGTLKVSGRLEIVTEWFFDLLSMKSIMCSTINRAIPFSG